jgi:hypothetical protein
MVPALTPVTAPDDDPTVATEASLPAHDIPPLVGSVYTEAEPTQILAGPDMVVGLALITTCFVPVVKGPAQVPGVVQVTTQK